MTCSLLVLNAMIGGDLETSLDAHRDLGLGELDVKTDWAGAMIEDSTPQQVACIAAAARARQLTVNCLSSGIGNCTIDTDTAPLDAALDRLLAFVPVLEPQRVRLILPRGDAAVVENEDILAAYGRWIERLLASGVQVVMENEIGNSIGRDPQLVRRFVENLDAGDKVGLIWDVANQWQDGRFPSLEDLAVLRPWLAMLHVKGGCWNDAGSRVYSWKAQLEESDWPVAGIVAAALEDGLDAICLNPPHGETPDSYGWDWAADLAYLRTIMEQQHV